MTKLLEHYTDPMGRITDEGYARINPRKYDPQLPHNGRCHPRTEKFIYEWFEKVDAHAA
jgi:hypothetical protein